MPRVKAERPFGVTVHSVDEPLPRQVSAVSGRFLRQLSSESRAADGGMAQLPSHLWCWLARHVSIADLGVILGCSKSIVSAAEATALWHYHAFTCGFARRVSRPSWIYPFSPETRVDLCIDWQSFLRLNFEYPTCSCVWVRVRNIDLRMPMQAGGDSAALTLALSSLVRQPHSSGRDGTFSALRLRMLQWAGRPGPVLDRPVVSGNHILLEWAQRDGWPLPDGPMIMERSELICATTPRSRSRLFSAAALVNACLRVGAPEVDLADASRVGVGVAPGPHLLVRLVASPRLVQPEVWLALNLQSATLGTLLQGIASSVKQHSPSCSAIFGEVQLCLEASAVPFPSDKPLRELCWAHSESLRLELSDSGVLLVHRDEGDIGKTGAATDSEDAPVTAVQLDNGSEGSSTVRAGHFTGGEGIAMLSEKQDTQQEADPVWWSDSAAQTSQARDGSRSLANNQGMLARESSAASAASALAATSPVDGHPGDSAISPEASEADNSELLDDSRERIVPHYRPRLLPSTYQSRQFEFHPSLPDVLLTGDKKGGVNVVDTKDDEARRPLLVDSCPVLGLSWMRHHPQSAVCGAAHSGKIRFLSYDPCASPGELALREVMTVDEFPKLSSLSINCTDDFLLASGFTHDLSLYDTQSGKVLHNVHGAHSNFINISRFMNRSPHIFATASFDHTCKLWDIRQPLLPNSPAKVLNTGGLNVMCTFSPDDRYLLCSGIDTRISQFEVPSFRRWPTFPLRPVQHQARYRRSMYFATGRHFVTAATDESHIRIMAATGKNLGVVDFRGLLRTSSPRAPERVSGVRRPPSVVNRFVSNVQRANGRQDPWLLGEAGPLVQGEVHLDEQGDPLAPHAQNKEYVQSVRTHPTVENRVAVLLSSYHPDPESYIALVHLDPGYSANE